MSDLIFHSSKKQDWETNPDLIKKINKYFCIALDVCAHRPNVCKNYYTAEQNGLEREWARSDWNWCNPPYSGENPAAVWIKAAHDAWIRDGIKTLMLIRSSTGTAAFQQHVFEATAVCFMAGRQRYGSDEQWAEHYGNSIMKTTDKGALARLSKKVGGWWLSTPERIQIASVLSEGAFRLWSSSKHLKPDPAGYDSLLVAFGDLTAEQRAFLESNGRVMCFV